MGMEKFVQMEEFRKLNVGFALDEGWCKNIKHIFKGIVYIHTEKNECGTKNGNLLIISEGAYYNEFMKNNNWTKPVALFEVQTICPF